MKRNLTIHITTLPHYQDETNLRTPVKCWADRNKVNLDAFEPRDIRRSSKNLATGKSEKNFDYIILNRP